MGSGKSLVGRRLSKVLQFDFMDLDAEIEASENAGIPEIFQDKGEIYFRRKEAEVLRNILSENKNLVLSTGGGTPCYGTVMKDLLAREDIVVVYLKNSLQALTRRLFPEKAQRPLIAHLESETLLNDFIRKHLFERSHYYNQAHLVLDCDGASPSEIIEKLILKLF